MYIYANKLHMSLRMRKPTILGSDLVRHKPACKSQKMSLEAYEAEELYYPSSENKDADQLCSNCTPDPRLWFHIDKSPAFS